MKGTEKFKETIKAYLDRRAQDDSLFAISYAKQHKSLDECVSYIISEVQKSGCNGFADNEIYGMAVHYYDEDSIANIEPAKANVVVNHRIELSESEKAELRAEARRKYEDEMLAAMRQKNNEQRKKATEKPQQVELKQGSLF